MKIKKWLSELAMAFFVCTTCITILEGILGMLFFSEDKISYNAFFSPPLFGIISVLFGLITKSGKELSVKQVLTRRVIHLLLIESMVFGLNYIAGTIFKPVVSFTLALSIAVVFVTVYVVLWVNDKRSADLFNEKLKIYQNREE